MRIQRHSGLFKKPPLKNYNISWREFSRFGAKFKIRYWQIFLRVGQKMWVKGLTEQFVIWFLTWPLIFHSINFILNKVLGYKNQGFWHLDDLPKMAQLNLAWKLEWKIKFLKENYWKFCFKLVKLKENFWKTENRFHRTFYNNFFRLELNQQLEGGFYSECKIYRSHSV